MAGVDDAAVGVGKPYGAAVRAHVNIWAAGIFKGADSAAVVVRGAGGRSSWALGVWAARVWRVVRASGVLAARMAMEAAVWPEARAP